MQVHVRDSLADDVIEGEERPLGSEGSLLSCAHPTASGQEVPEEVLGHLGEDGVVGARDDEGVAVEHGPVVQEGHTGLVLEQQVGG